MPSKQASESINPYPKEDDDENCINEDVVEEIAVTLPWEIFWYSYHFLIF
jgi:predicted transcriptional regulator